tara:strand:+ start:394 stop:1362 length:969 start_codon:yes stop_codon:yes gene_type:complete
MKSKIQLLAGDASFRKFYRFTDLKKNKIIVLAEKEKYKNLVAYSAVNKFLREKKILTPKLYDYNYSKGIIIIEDFGDISFYKEIFKKKNKFAVYKKLINLLLKIQKIKPKKKIRSFIKKNHIIHKYSNKYLHNESDLFFDWYLPLFFKKKKVKKIKKEIKDILSKLYNNLYFKNNYFVHRDFHCQNLIKVGKNVAVIDSQDALIGNPAYDLVSLVDDVRIKTSNKIKNQLYDYYLNRAPKNITTNSKNFLSDFNILSVQRSLKIIGIFSRLFIRDKKKIFLKYIPYTWQLLESRMSSESFSELRETLNKNISKKIRKKNIMK